MSAPPRRVDMRRGRRTTLPREVSRRAVRRTRRAALVSLTALLVVALCLAGIRLYNAGWLRISEVQVTGAGAVGEDAIRDAAALTGQSYLTADTNAAARRVAALPRVKAATVNKYFPHRLSITVTERQPAGIWRIGAVNYSVDPDGVILEAVDGDSGLPVIDAGLDNQAVAVGERIDPEPLRVAQRVASFLSTTTAQSAVRFAYDKASGLTVTTDRGTTVRLGDGQNLDFKLAVWRDLLVQVSTADLHELDLRYGDHPYFR